MGMLGQRAADLGREIEAGRLDPVDLTEGYLAAIAAHPDGARIYSAVMPERARAEAAAARDRARLGLRLGPLDGVPISWKDLVDSAGVATEAGSRLLAGRVPASDGAVLAAATLGGSVALGKTHLTELAFSGLGLNPMTATPPNALAPAHAPGGSSSGAAVSVALGLAAGAIGSDTGGSVRVPAAWNDLVGLKTTAGRVSLAGVVALCARFDTIGPLARSVEDAAELLALIEGTRAPDLRGARLAGSKLAVLETVALEGLCDAQAAAFEEALAALAKAGAEITAIARPEVEEAMGLAGPLYTAEAYGTWGARIEAAPEAMYPPVRERFRAGRDVGGAEYVAAWQTLDRARARWRGAVAGFDAVLIPSVPSLPPEIARLEADPDYFVAENLLALRNTRIGNLLGLSALTLPTGRPHCGLMLMGAPFGEARLLRLGAAVEAALGVG